MLLSTITQYELLIIVLVMMRSRDIPGYPDKPLDQIQYLSIHTKVSPSAYLANACARVRGWPRVCTLYAHPIIIQPLA